MSKVIELVGVREAAKSGEAREVRLRAGLSLREVAEAVNVGTSTIYRWETAERRPRGKAALRYGRLISDLKGSLPGEADP